MITVFSRPGCSSCKTVKMLLEKHSIMFDYVEVIAPSPGVDYPQIYVDAHEVNYNDFLKKIKNGEIT